MIKLPNIAFIQKLSDKYGKGVFVFVGLLGVFLIFLSENSEIEYTEKNNMIEIDYRLSLQQELVELLTEVEGAGRVEVMLTLESSRENVYAWQEKTSENSQSVSAADNNQTTRNSTYENRIVTVGQSGTKDALIEKVLQPSVQGVAVVCEGADNIKVVSDITNAVSVVLNIPSNRVCVIKMQ